MSLIEWSANLEIGVRLIDTQHAHLVSLINQLEIAVRGGSGAASLQATLQDLTIYISEHFRVEEQLMEAVSYPGAARHKLFHQYFSKRLNDFSKRFSSGEASVPEDLLEFLKLWFVDHVSQTDLDYVPYVQKH